MIAFLKISEVLQKFIVVSSIVESF